MIRLVAILASISAASAAIAQPTPARLEVAPAAQQIFERDWVLMNWALKFYDADRDILLSTGEAARAAGAFREMADTDGVVFLRTLRGKTPVRTPAGEARIGGSRVAHEGDDVAIIACGITVDEAVRAAEALAADGIEARVLDCYSIKPIDAEAVRAAARECGAVITVEDHWPEGGLGDAVLEALAEADDSPPVTKLAVREMPGSGTPEELLHWAGIDAEGIATAARAVARAAA